MTEFQRDEDGNAIAVDCDACGKTLGFKLESGYCDFSEAEGTETDDVALCTSCSKFREWRAWFDSTVAQVEKVAEECGWRFDRYSGDSGLAGQRLTTYFELSHPQCLRPVKLRISDHSDARLDNDISLAMDPCGDDSTTEGLRKLLMDRLKEFPIDDEDD